MYAILFIFMCKRLCCVSIVFMARYGGKKKFFDSETDRTELENSSTVEICATHGWFYRKV